MNEISHLGQKVTDFLFHSDSTDRQESSSLAATHQIFVFSIFSISFTHLYDGGVCFVIDEWRPQL